jgi:hypothetical protein
MLLLSNDQLDVSILDPVQDRERLGSRYCVGGYIYTVTDQRLGVITSGPEYPESVYPPVFDGQGLPEAFPSFLVQGSEPASGQSLPEPGTEMLILGVGMARATVRETFRKMPVDDFSVWEIERSANSVLMRTHQAFAGWSADLTREVTLINRTIISRTSTVNVGRDSIQFRWFAHPFFPNPWGECCKFNLPISCAENVGYELRDDGWIHTKTDHSWDLVGHFQVLPFESTERMVAFQRHPKLGLITATCSFTPSWLPIWGNKNTFSFEPYLERTLAPGGESTWSITYDF